MTKEDKLKRKIKRNEYVLEQWHKSITKYYVLSSKEAKKLMHCYTRESDENKKTEIRNVIVLGTLEYVYQFLRQSIFINIICNWFDMEDVINATIEAWIKKIEEESKRIVRISYVIDSSYTLYSINFMNKILANLYGKDSFGFSNFSMKKIEDMVKWFYLYLKEKQLDSEISFADFKKIISSHNYKIDEANLLKIYDIIKYLERVLMINLDEVSLESFNSLKLLIFNYLNMSTIRFDNCLPQSEDDWINGIINPELASKILRDYECITAQEQALLYKLFFVEINENTIARENGDSRQKISAQKIAALSRLRKKYNQDMDEEM